MSYFNTTNESGQDLSNSLRKATTQEQVVFELFKQFKTASPSQIFKVWTATVGNSQPPLTSIRRAINSLTKDLKIVKTEEKSLGIYGKKEFIWKIATWTIK